MFTVRDTIDIELTDPYFTETKISILDWSKVRIRVPGSKTRLFDIGSWAYYKRQWSSKNKNIIKVDPLTEDKRMHGLIKLFALALYYKHRMGRSTYTLIGEHRAFNHFINWLESNENSNIFSKSSAQAFYSKYSFHLEGLITSNIFVQSTAAYSQSIVRKTFANYFNIDEKKFSSGIRVIRKTASISAEPLTESDIIRTYKLYFSLFTQIAPFLLSKLDYPLRLDLPQEPLYVFPLTKWMATKESLSKREKWTSGSWAWNYESGIINNIQDIAHHYKTKKQCKSVIKHSTQVLQRSNEDKNCFHRHRLGMLAHDSFVFLFSVNTGMNMSSLTNLQWDDKYEVVTEHQGFRTIKNRAQGIIVEFQITSVFLPVFQKYLKLREYLLQEQHFDYLFFSKGSKLNGQNVRQISKTVLQELHQKTKQIDLSIPHITMREIRAFKQDRLISTTDIKISAEIMQHSTDTALQHYSQGSQQDQVSQLTLFYKQLNKSIITSPSTSQLSENILTGHCKSNQSPTPIDTDRGTIKPDCIQPEGCLFCKHYRLHADEQDIRKLVSIRYVINESRYNAASEEHFNALYGTTLKRIDSLFESLKQLSESTKDLVNEVIYDVDNNENLSPYWQHKLNMLSIIGAI